MSKLTCRCGHVIRDQTDQLPFKASIIRDQDEDRLLGRVGAAATELVTAAKEGRIDQLIEERFGTNWRPSFRDAVEEIVTQPFIDEMSIAYECEACGRIWLNRKGTHHFHSFSSDNDRYEGLLAGNNGKNGHGDD